MIRGWRGRAWVRRGRPGLWLLSVAATAAAHLAAAGALFAQDAEEGPALGGLYRASDFGFEIRYPIGWRLVEAAARDEPGAVWGAEVLIGDELHKATFLEQGDHVWPGELQVRVLANPRLLGLDEWIREYEATEAVDVSGGSLVTAVDEATLGERPARRLTVFRFDAYGLELVASHGEWIVTIAYTGTTPNDPDLERHRRLHEAMVRSFRFLEPPAGASDGVRSARVSLKDWGLSDPSAVRWGQVGEMHEPSRSRLEVYRLDRTPPPDFADHSRSAPPPMEGNSFIVTDFDSGNRNQLGGFFNAFHRSPSWARTALAPAPDGRVALRLTYAREEAGFCGVWIHLFDVTRTPDERLFFDARSLPTLSFWIRGERGGEQVLLKLADADWERKQDAWPLGEVAEFLPAGRIEREWQRAVVPLAHLDRRIERSALASIVLEGLSPGPQQVYVSRLAFSRAPEPLPDLPAARQAAATPRRPARATWVWNTAELLEDAGKRDSLLRFLGEQGFEAVFLQLVGAPEDQRPVGEIRPDPRLRSLVAGMTRRGARVYALDGFRAYALREYHPRVLTTIGNVIRHNQESAAAERFHGVWYDIEPYLLPGFHGPRREGILRQYLDLLVRAAGRARAGGLVFGADIPFWYDAPAEHTFAPVTVTFRGALKPVSHHVLDVVDAAAVMDYRTTAYGADGTIRHGEGELAYATALGKPVWIGLETGPLPDETLLDFGGEPRRGLPGELLPDDYVGLAQRGDSAAVFSVPLREERRRSAVLEALGAGLAEAGLDAAAMLWWPVARRIAVPGEKLSFAMLGPERLREIEEETAREFGAYDAFAGFAIHHAESLQRLLGGDAP